MTRFRVAWMCFALFCAGPALAQETSVSNLETRVRSIVIACADAVAGAPVAEAFAALPLSPPRVMGNSIFAIVAPELVEWFGSGANVRDQSFGFAEGNAFVHVDETGGRCRAQAFTYEPSAIADVARQALQTRNPSWAQSTADTWATSTGSSARVQANDLMTGGSEVIVEIVRGTPASPAQ